MRFFEILIFGGERMKSVKVRFEKDEVDEMEQLRDLWFETYGIRLSASGFVSAMYRIGLRNGFHEFAKDSYAG
jgi:hypothetical protein